MKKHLLLLLTMMCLSTTTSFAALPDGSPAADWTLTDLDGNTHTLSDYLNAGIPAIIDFSATWCPPCWNYHNQGTLENLYTQYGPNGSNEMMVFFIEPDGSTNTDCIYGLNTCQGGTMGDWVTGTDYPIIDLIGANLSVGTDYNVTYFPTLYGISPDGRTWEVGQASQSVWENWMLESFSLAATGTVERSLCGNNGTIDIVASGGYNNLSYNWSNGASGAYVTGLAPGTYTVTISDANGYFIEQDYTVDGPTSGVALGLEVLALTDVDCNGNFTGSAEVQGIDGNYGYSYDWSNGDSGPMAFNLPSGVHTVTVTDLENCEETMDITINQPDPVNSIPITTGDPCNLGLGEVFFVIEGGTGNHYFDIGNGPEQSIQFFDLPAGNYPYVHTDDNGCQFNNEFVIEITGIPVAMATTNAPLDCINEVTTVTSSGSSSGSEYEYLWTTTNGNITSDPTLPEIVVDQAGDYNLEVINAAYGCSEMASATVDQTAVAPLADAGAASTLTCNTTSLALDGSGSDAGANYSYLWSTTDGNIVDGGDGLTPTVDATGTYTIEVTNSTNGCSSTSDVIIPGNFDVPSIATTDNEITCTTTTVQICATVEAGSTVTWDTPNGPVSELCIDVTSAGTFRATATGTNGCTSTSDATVTQSADIPQTTIQAPAMITCEISEITITGTLVGDINEHTILWTTTNGNIVSGENTLTPVVNMGGSYTMSATNNSNGCSSQISETVEADVSLPNAAFSYANEVGTLTLTNGSSNSMGDVIWDLGNGETATGNTIEVDYDETGIYNVCVTVSNECGESTDCQEIQFITVMSYNQDRTDLQCNGDNSGVLTVEPMGGLEPYSISWTGPNGYTNDQLTISGLAPGTYTMILKDGATNEITESFDVMQPAALLASGESTDVNCFGGSDGSATIMVVGGTAPYTYDWGSVDPDNLPVGDHTVNIADANGCPAEAMVTINQPDEIINTMTDIVNATGGQSNGSITISPEGGTGTITVTWDNGLTGASITDLDPGFYIPTLEDDNGCKVTLDQIEVEAKGPSSVADLEFVNAFTLSPNPASNFVNISLDLNKNIDLHLTIKNTVGQIVYKDKYINTSNISTSLDVSQFDAGMYIVVIGSNNSSAASKFIVVK